MRRLLLKLAGFDRAWLLLDQLLIEAERLDAATLSVRRESLRTLVAEIRKEVAS